MTPELILKNIAKHISLSQNEADMFCALLEPAQLRKKEFLLRPNEVCKHETFVEKGCLRTYTIDKNGFEHVIGFATEDWWAGDLYSFFTQKPSNFFIDALEDCQLWQISAPNLERVYTEIPKFERFSRIIIQNAFIAQQQRINQSLTFTAEERYTIFIEKYPQLEQRISQRQVAAYLGITPEFLSMIRRKIATKKR
jgi:CRP-like cAMP-binding protein